MSTQTLEDAVEQISTSLAQTNFAELVGIRRKTLADVDRVEMSRLLPGCSRYVEFHVTDDEAMASEFAILFGEAGGPTDTDGRRLGDLDYLIAFIQAWLIDLCPLQSVPGPP